ncbi:MAG TPA: hypothetical protein VK970_23810, partial [Candidatus Methylacidiphilales bacterium]|nr:hypothetical protein [Candidatus Methylacidiphilales bacterium]
MASNSRSTYIPLGLAAIVLAALAYFGLRNPRPSDPSAAATNTPPTAAETEAQSKERLRQLSEKLARADILEADRHLRSGRHDQALACLARAIRTNGSRPAEIRLMSLFQYRNWAMPVGEDRVKSAKWKPSMITPYTESAAAEGDNSAAGRLTPVDTSATALERLASLTPEGARRLRALDGGVLLQLLDATTNLPYMDIPQEAPMRSAALSTDGRWLAASAGEVKSWKAPLAATDNMLHYWDTMRGNAIITPVEEL